VGGWRRLHNEELHSTCASPNIIKVITLRRMRWAGRVDCMGRMMNAYRILVRKFEGNRPVGKPTCKWEYNIKMNVTERGREIVF
jgi:hypothetical protein